MFTAPSVIAVSAGDGGLPPAIGIPFVLAMAAFVVWYRFFRKR